MSLVTLALGPSPYADRLVQALLASRVLLRVIHHWPDPRVDRPAGDRLTTESTLPGYGLVRRLTWSLWRRLPVLHRHETPRAPLFALFDRLAARHLHGCRLFVGWSQVSLHSLQQAQALGAQTLLEHPMSHVATWMAHAEREQARFGRRGAGSHSLFPAALVRRMEAEYRAAQHIAVPSRYAERSFIDAGVPRHKLVRIPLGVDPDHFRERPTPTPGRPFRVLYVGRLELLKGVPYLLQAFSALPMKDAELWLVGRVLPEIQPALARLADRRVRVLGPVPHEALPALYQAADVFVFPSVNDAFELVTLEAMASGLPVIASAHGAGPDVLDRGGGYVVPPREPAALAERIAQLYDRRDEAIALGRQAREQVVARFTWAQYAERVLAAYQGLLHLHPGPQAH